jgi:hypothetical protein
MHPDIISRVVSLVQKSGDKVVLADPTSGKAVVVLDLDAYEQLSAAAAAAINAAPEPVPAPVATAVATPTPEPAPQLASSPAMHHVHAPVVAPAPPLRPQPIPAPQAPATGPVSAAAIASAFGIPAPKKAQHSAENQAATSAKKGIRVTPETMDTPHVMADLTQEQLIDKINRDIGAWKTAQETRRTNELKTAVAEKPVVEPENALEEEERFFLEPIE